MSENKQVSIAKHGYFYKVFFSKHKELLENLIELSYTNLKNGYTALNVFYSSYSYWLKESNEDDSIKILLREKIEELVNNEEYNYLKRKVSISPNKLDLKELKKLNEINNKTLTDILIIFEDFIFRFAPSDMLPNLTDAKQEYERSIVFVIYDTFYESLFNIHAKISDLLLNFNIIQFKDVIQILQIFFYGYSYYLQKPVKGEVNILFDKLIKYYNDDKFLLLYLKALNDSLTSQDLTALKVYRDEIYLISLEIFEFINGDLPKSNLMPRKTEKVLIDDTLI